MYSLGPINWDDLKEGHEKYYKHAGANRFYKIAKETIDNYWPNFTRVTDGIAIFLFTWNYPYYRGAKFDYIALEQLISNHKEEIDEYRKIKQFEPSNVGKAVDSGLFKGLLNVTSSNWRPNTHSPVSVAKALHILCPVTFPLWDNNIAKNYGYYWSSSKQSARKYIEFTEEISKVIDQLGRPIPKPPGEENLLKWIDEWNWIKYHK